MLASPLLLFPNQILNPNAPGAPPPQFSQPASQSKIDQINRALLHMNSVCIIKTIYSEPQRTARGSCPTSIRNNKTKVGFRPSRSERIAHVNRPIELNAPAKPT